MMYRVKVTKEASFEQYVEVLADSYQEAEHDATQEAMDLDKWDEQEADYKADVVEEIG